MYNKFSSEHVITTKHYLVLCTIAYVSGIFCAVKYNTGYALFLSVGFLVLLSAVSVITYCLKKTSSSVKKYIFMPLLLSVFFLIGISRICWSQQISEKSLRSYADESMWLYGTVSTVPKTTSSGYSASFEMQIRGISKNNTFIPIKDKIVLYTPVGRCKDLMLSDDILCWADVSYPKNDKSDDLFDYHMYLKGKNIYVIGNTKNVNKIDNLDSIFPSNIADLSILKISELGSQIRSKITYAADKLFSYNADANAILKGILVGDKSGFSDELYTQFANAGISHIVAVSGMHLSIFFAALNLIFSSIYLNRKTVFILTVPCLVLFVSTAGFSPSVCRAALMLLLMMTAALISERYNSITSLFFALAVIITFTPYALFSPGLVLSFGATLGILVYAKYLQHIMNHPVVIKKYFSPITNSISLSAASFIGTAYFTVLFFNRLSWIQALTNLWVIPLVSVIFCGGYLCCIFYYLLPEIIVNIIRYPVAGALKIVTETSRFFGKDCFSFYIPPEYISDLLPFTYLGTAIILYLMCKNASDSLRDNLMR